MTCENRARGESDSTCRLSVRRCGLAVALALCLLGWAEAQITFRQDGSPSAKIPDPPREMRQALQRAEKAIELREYSTAVEILNDILTRVDAEDFFLDHDAKTTSVNSIKRSAQNMLGSMPPAGREILELKYGHDAARRLERALETTDIGELREISRQHTNTNAGYLATYLVARFEMDQQRPLAAALQLRGLRSSAGAEEFEPELSLLYALCLHQTGQSSAALEVLTQLHQDRHAVQFMLRGEPHILPTRVEELPGWLETVAAGTRTGGPSPTSDWCMARGNPMRNAFMDGGMPLPEAEYWIATTIFDDDRRRIERFELEQRASSHIALPAIQPLAVGDLLMMRTHSLTFGVNLKTGLPIWVVPWDRAENVQPVSQDESGIAAIYMKLRTWDDLVYGQLSSDGKTLFAIIHPDDETQNSAVDAARLQWRGMFGAAGGVEELHNQLVAIDMTTEGKYLWTVGGPDGDESGLANAFFLGSPLPLDDRLYAIAEIKDEIKLVVLDAATGKLLWSQQLAQVEVPLAYDGSRRMAGCVPSYSDGVLVCPTASGVLVAVDLATRSLLWGYAHRIESANQRSAIGIGTRTRPSWTLSADRWTDELAILADGYVVYTPVASDRLHCLNLLTGQEAWKPKVREEGLYVAGVVDSRIILIGTRSISALDIDTGRAVWQTDWPDNTAPSGRGFISQGSLFLPTNDAAMVRVRLEDGQITERVETGVTLGNLVCHRDYLISQGPDAVRVFRLRDRTRTSVKQRLSENPHNREALRDQVTILVSDGNLAEALDVVKKLEGLESDVTMLERYTRQKVKLLLQLLEQDFGRYHDQIAGLETLIDEPRDRQRLQELRANQLFDTGQAVAAFTAYLGLIDGLAAAQPGSDATPADDLIAMDPPTWSLARPRWYAMRLQRLLDESTEPERAEMLSALHQQLQTSSTRHSAPVLNMFMDYMPDAPSVTAGRLKLSQRSIAAGNYLAAELALEQCLSSGEHRGTALAIQAQLYSRFGATAEAASAYEALRSEFANQAVLDGFTGTELWQQFASRRQQQGDESTATSWPRGKVVIEPHEGELDQAMPGLREVPLVQASGSWPATHRIKLNLDARSPELLVLDGSGQLLIRSPIDISAFTRATLNLHSANAYGHLLVVSLGNSLHAIDTLSEVNSPTERSLWSTGDRQRVLAQQFYTSGETFNLQRSVNVPVFNREIMIRATLGGRSVGSVGPLGSHGACYLEKGELRCVDLLTGAPFWVRHGVDEKVEIFGDDQYLFVVSEDSRAAMVYSSRTGEELGQREVPHHERRWRKMGRYVLTWEAVEVMRTPVNFRLYDCWEGKDVWNRQFDPASRGCVIGTDQLAVLGPDGTFEVWRIIDGATVLSTTLPDAPAALGHIEVIRSPDQYLLLTNVKNDARMARLRTAGINIISPRIEGDTPPLIKGRMYAFDRQTGKELWPAPVTVDEYYVPSAQPANLPVVAFIRTLTSRQQARGNITRSSLVCVDKRTGESLFADHQIRRPLETFKMTGDLERQVVSIQTASSDPGERSSLVHLRFTDEPRAKSATAPLPPVEASQELDQDRSGKRTRDGLEDLFGQRNPTPRRLGSLAFGS